MSRLSDETYRHDMALASTLHGMSALDRKLRTSYIPGNSGSDFATVRSPPPRPHRTAAAKGSHVDALHAEGSNLKPMAHYFVE